MKRISNHLLTTLAAVGLLGATALGQAVSGTGAPRKPSPPGTAGAESTTQGTGATGGVTDSGTRTTSHGSELAPGSLHSIGGPSTAVDPARITGSGNTAGGNVSTSRFTPGAPGVPNGVGVGTSGRGAVTSGTDTRTTIPDRAVMDRATTDRTGTAPADTRRNRRGNRGTETTGTATTTTTGRGADAAGPATTITTGRGAGAATTGPGTSAPTLDTGGSGTGTGGVAAPPLPATLPGATTTAPGSTR